MDQDAQLEELQEAAETREVINYLLGYEISNSWIANNIRIPFIQTMTARYYYRLVMRKLLVYIKFNALHKAINDKEDKKNTE